MDQSLFTFESAVGCSHSDSYYPLLASSPHQQHGGVLVRRKTLYVDETACTCTLLLTTPVLCRSTEHRVF